MTRRTVALAMTGASGAAYGLRLLECLLAAERTVYLMISQAGQVVIAQETDMHLPAQPQAARSALLERFAAPAERLEVFGPQQWYAPVASGSAAPDAMVVCPCTSGTLSAIANGASDNLIDRAADVVIKEQRKLIVVPRETPCSAICLENMLKLARLGVVVLPANPGFYHRPATVADLVDFVVARVLDHLEVPHDLVPRWPDTAAEGDR